MLFLTGFFSLISVPEMVNSHLHMKRSDKNSKTKINNVYQLNLPLKKEIDKAFYCYGLKGLK